MKVLTSPSRSSASSSGDDEEKKEAYRDDVRDFTAAYAAEYEDLDGASAQAGGSYAINSTPKPPPVSGSSPMRSTRR
jgi:hypothetical protein